MGRPLTRGERCDIRREIHKLYTGLIDEIIAKHPRLDEQIDKKATEEAIKALGITKLMQERETAAKAVERAEEKLKEIEHKISKKLPKERTGSRRSCPQPMDLCEAVNKMKETVLPAVQADDPVYARILELRKDRDTRLRKLEAITTREDLNKHRTEILKP